MMTQEEIMREAIALSTHNVKTGNGGPFAAVIVKDGRIIARGTNHVTTENDPTAHAEIVAIREACRTLGSFQLTGCDVYTTCEPCPMCLGAIYWARPDRIFYANTRSDAKAIGFDDDFIYEEISRPLEARAIPMSQMMNDEALEAFNAWKNTNDKTHY
jgi:guanine deaminase